MNEDMFRIGVITSTHGLKGEVKVFPTTDDPARFKKLKKCFIRTKSGDVPVEKKSCKFFKNMVILSFSITNASLTKSSIGTCLFPASVFGVFTLK